MAFSDCIRAALDEGLISQEDHDRLIERYKLLSRDDPANARKSLAEEEAKRAANAKRARLLQTVAQDALYKDVRRATLLRADRNQAPDLIRTAYAFFENISGEGVESIRGKYSALLGASHAELADFLHTFRRSALSLKRFNRPLLDDVVRAGFEENVSEESKALYGAWRTIAEKLRTLYNEAGGRIDWREDWGLPQSHSAEALIRAGFEKWRAFIEPRLNWDAMGQVVAGGRILPEERGDVLRHVFESITQDGWNSRDLEGGFTGGKSFANRRADHRFLVFRNADDWLDYARNYGRGEPFEIMMGHVRSMARDIAIMQRLGPNPAASVDWLKKLVQKEAALFKAGEPSLFGDGAGMFGKVSRQSAELKAYEAGATLDGFYETARGLSAPRSPVGDAMGALRNVQYAAKLGSAVLLDLTVNPVVQMGARYMHGLPMTGIVMDTLRTLKDPAEILQAGMIVDDAIHTLERGAREQGAMRSMRELSAWLPKYTSHYSGMEAIQLAQRSSAYQAIMAQTANLRGLDWGALPDRYKDMLRGYAIEPKDWDIIRAATPHEPTAGAPFLRARDIAAIGAEGEAIAQKYLGMIYGVGEQLAPSTNWRAKAFMNRIGAHEGTAYGELVRSAAMFKSGFMATFMLTQLRMMGREWGKNGFGAMAGYATSMGIALGFMGMVGYQFKQLAAGKDLASVDPATEEGRLTWARGLLASGALGLMGDFLQSEVSSYGHGYVTTAVGPMVTGALDTLGALGVKKFDPGGGAVRFLRNNTPVLSTHWALRSAYNRIFLDQLQFMTDPEAHQHMRRMQEKLRRETGQGYWWRPGESAPERLPALAP